MGKLQRPSMLLKGNSLFGIYPKKVQICMVELLIRILEHEIGRLKTFNYEYANSIDTMAKQKARELIEEGLAKSI